jgi:hypothetical protein
MSSTDLLFGRRLMSRAAPRRVQRDVRPAVAVGEIAPETTAMASAPASPAASPPTGPMSPTPPPFVPNATPAPMTTKETLGWLGSLVGLVSGAAFGFARGGLFPALGYGVLGTAVGTGAGLIAGNLIADPTHNPIG